MTDTSSPLRIAIGETLAPYVLQYVFPAAFSLLPEAMETIEAKAMLLAIGLQESRFQHRHQIGGSAHGFYQFEKFGGVKGVLTHTLTVGYIKRVCQDLSYQPSVHGCYLAIEHNDVLASVFARLLILTHPSPLPRRNEAELAWVQYLDTWRPGKPKRASWNTCYDHAWTLVQP